MSKTAMMSRYSVLQIRLFVQPRREERHLIPSFLVNAKQADSLIDSLIDTLIDTLIH